MLQRKGVCPDNIVPKKDPAFGQALLSPEHYAVAENFKIKHYARVFDIDELKLALVADGPVVASFKMFNFGKYMWRQKNSENVLIGPHTMNIVGYNKKGFIVRNSWGSRWGHGGYTIYPYADWGELLCGRECREGDDSASSRELSPGRRPPNVRFWILEGFDNNFTVQSPFPLSPHTPPESGCSSQEGTLSSGRASG